MVFSTFHDVSYYFILYFHLISRLNGENSSKMNRRIVMKCGDRIRTEDRTGAWNVPQYGRIEFPITKSVDVLFAAAYDSYAMHTGILLRTNKEGMRYELPYVKGGYRTTYSHLLIHMIERRNVVRVLFEFSNTDSEILERVGDVGLLEFPEKCVRRLVSLGTTKSLKCEELESAARLIERELEKPLFPLSKSEADTSCLHLAMRLANAFDCMPKWTWLKTQLPDAPVEKTHSRL